MPVSLNNTQVVFNDATTQATAAVAATVAPLANGTAVTGTSLQYARQDHVHAAGAAASQAGRLLRITRFTTAGSGTWTKPSDCVSVLILAIGAGGGSGGNNGTDSGNGSLNGAITNLFIPIAAASYAFVVGAGGAGGAGGSSAAGNGSPGGATTIAGIAGGGGTLSANGVSTGGFQIGNASGIQSNSIGGVGRSFGCSGTPKTNTVSAGFAGAGGYIEIQEYS